MGKEKLPIPKFDSFHKHVGRKKITSSMSNVPKGIFYYAKDCQHVKNEVFYVSKSGESVFDRVLQGVAHEGLKKNHLICLLCIPKRKPMFGYESMNGLL
jgi:hypothetical protein